MSIKTWLARDRIDLQEPEPDLAFGVDIPPEMMEAMNLGGSIAPRISRREALQVPAVLRSRNLIAGTLARLPIHIRDKDRKIVEPTTLLAQIDPNVPNVVTFAETYEDLLFESTSWWKVLERGWHGFPTYATHVDISRVHVTGWLPPVNGSSPTMPLGEARVYIDGRPVADDEVIRFDSPNPPLLVHAARAIRAALALDQAAARYAAEPVPLGYFTPRDGLKPREDEETITTLLDRWEQARSRRVWGYVGAALEAKKLQFDAAQIQLAEQRQHAVLEISRAAGVDPEDLGVSTTSRTYQNAEQRRLDLLDFTLAHYMAAMEQRLSMRDIIPRGYEAKVNLDGFLRSDTKTRYEAHQIALNAGFKTIPEIRELEDLPNIRMPKPVPVLPGGEDLRRGTSSNETANTA
jgi:Phage portal protein